MKNAIKALKLLDKNRRVKIGKREYALDQDDKLYMVGKRITETSEEEVYLNCDFSFNLFINLTKNEGVSEC